MACRCSRSTLCMSAAVCALAKCKFRLQLLQHFLLSGCSDVSPAPRHCRRHSHWVRRRRHRHHSRRWRPDGKRGWSVAILKQHHCLIPPEAHSAVSALFAVWRGGWQRPETASICNCTRTAQIVHSSTVHGKSGGAPRVRRRHCSRCRHSRARSAGTASALGLCWACARTTDGVVRVFACLSFELRLRSQRLPLPQRRSTFQVWKMRQDQRPAARSTIPRLRQAASFRKKANCAQSEVRNRSKHCSHL